MIKSSLLTLSQTMRIGTVIAVTIATQIVLGQSLTVGSNAPALQVSRWIKGTPVTNFEKGKTYVVEFWATWCGPCKEAMPHLTEMAKKYAGKVIFTGCDVFERFPNEEATNKAVDSFVRDMGEKMGYNVCQDGPAHTMANTWMKPALQDGIPCSFVIDGSGKIAWIGHPMELDAALGQILAGTFDAKKFEAQFKAYQEQMKQRQELQDRTKEMMKPYGAAWKAKDYATVVSEYDKVTVKEPALIPGLRYSYYIALIHSDFNRALSVAKASKMTDYVAMLAALQENLPKSDYDFAVDTLKDSPEMTKTSQMVGILASAYFNDRLYSKALETIQKQIDMANKHGGYSDDDMKPLYDNLKKYQEAARANPGK